LVPGSDVIQHVRAPELVLPDVVRIPAQTLGLTCAPAAQTKPTASSSLDFIDTLAFVHMGLLPEVSPTRAAFLDH